jgi:hypothetical protein
VRTFSDIWLEPEPLIDDRLQSCSAAIATARAPACGK